MSLKNSPKPELRDQKRLVILAFFIVFLFSVLVFQFYKIQIQQHEKWTKIANRQHYFTVQEPFLRGRFYSNTSIKRAHPENEQAFVVDILKFHLHADPDSIPQQFHNEVARNLAALLELSKEEDRHLREQFEYKSRNRKLVPWLDKESRDLILGWWLPYAKKLKIPRNALFFVHDYQRSYPFGKLLGQVLHTVQNQKDEVTQQAIPTGGLELCFDHYLRGKLGKRRLMRSPRHAFETGDVISKPQNGADIYLTVNHCLQAIVEEELEKGVKKAKAKGGWAVMMEPKTGEILALAQYPYFYPPDYQTYFNDPRLIEDTKIKALSDTIEPGSIFKPIPMTIALKANEELVKRGEKPLFDPNEMMPTSNSHFKGRGKPLQDTHLHYYLNMYLAIQKSSNIYPARLMEKVVERLGPAFIRQNLTETFGFGSKTHIELPAESPGVVPTPGRKHPNGKEEWSISTPCSLAFGHNIQVTSIQMLRAFAVFINGGYLVQPTIVRKIVQKYEDGSSKVLLDNTDPARVKNFPHVLPQKYCDEMVKCLKYTTKIGGTARRADVPGYTEGGKTSTAKKLVNGAYSETLYCPSFVGFTPAKDPAFILIVTIDEPEYGYTPGIGLKHHGGVCAAPVFREIAIRSLAYLGTRPPDDPYGYPVGDPRRDSTKADWAKEIRELKEIYEKWNIPK
ncbi:MAG: penicillin-binding protein [Chlamydiales bacterium 38-26]|nr:penicillin-binding protein 2 [Chlamydiales bacterium]OJV10855.1 MAG: penicillin-binding protein [Chlamydiales bacterium 38-26]